MRTALYRYYVLAALTLLCITATSHAEVLAEYTIGRTTGNEISSTAWTGQTFTITGRKYIEAIRFEGLRTGTPGTCTIKLWATSGGRPIGTALASQTFNGNLVTATFPGQFVTVTLTNPLYVTTGTYAWSVQASAGGLIINRDATGEYAGGHAINYAGGSWSISSGADQMFGVDGSTAPFSGGSGTIGDPYQVATAADFQLISMYLDRHFIQTADIAGVTAGVPGTFSGVYDGQGYILGVAIVEHYAAPFYSVSGTVKRLNIMGSVRGTYGAAGIVYTLATTGQIADSRCDAAIIDENEEGIWAVGVAREVSQGGSILNTLFLGTVFSRGNKGGVIGDGYTDYILNAYYDKSVADNGHDEDMYGLNTEILQSGYLPVGFMSPPWYVLTGHYPSFNDWPTVSTPSISPPSGTYTEAVSVTVTCPTVGAVIRYTTNSTVPTSASPVYTEAIEVSASATVKAVAYKANHHPSTVAAAYYTLIIPGDPNTPPQQRRVRGRIRGHGVLERRF